MPPINDSLALQAYFRGLSSAPAASRAMDYLAAQQARKQQAETEFNQILQAQKFQSGENRMREDAADRRARMAADEYWKRLEERERQELLADYARRGFVPKPGEPVGDFIIRANREEESQAEAQLQALEDDYEGLNSERVRVAGEIDSIRSQAAEAVAKRAVMGSGLLNSKQLAIVNDPKKGGWDGLISSLRKDNSQLYSEVEDFRQRAYEEALAKIPIPADKQAAFEGLTRSLSNIDLKQKSVMQQNPRVKLPRRSARYDGEFIGPRPAQANKTDPIDDFTKTISESVSKSETPAEVKALSRQQQDFQGLGPLVAKGLGAAGRSVGKAVSDVGTLPGAALAQGYENIKTFLGGGNFHSTDEFLPDEKVVPRPSNYQIPSYSGMYPVPSFMDEIPNPRPANYQLPDYIGMSTGLMPRPQPVAVPPPAVTAVPNSMGAAPQYSAPELEYFRWLLNRAPMQR